MTAEAGSDGDLDALVGNAAYELRFSLHGRTAVRVLAPRGPVARRHAEPPDPAAAWSAAARCGDAAGWLLAERAPADEGHAAALLQRIVDRRCALALQRLAAQRAAMAADLLERVTHRLRTDVSTLQAVAEGALLGVFEADELTQIPGELKRVGREAQRQLSLVREVMTALHPKAPLRAEPLVAVLRAELEGAGVATVVSDVDGECAMTFVPGAGWGACARLLAMALAHDARLGGPAAAVAVRADPGGWLVTAGRSHGDPRPVEWTERAVGELVHAGEIAAAGGGSACATGVGGDGLHVQLTLPAAPSLSAGRASPC